MTNNRNLKLTVAYDGTSYRGFQWQQNALGVQQVLEEKLAKIFGHQLKITGAARTDAGVHAYGQVISFRTDGAIPTDRIVLAAPGVLPPDIVVVNAEEKEAGFNARRSAKSKIYRYRLLNKKAADPFERNRSWNCRNPLDVGKMNAAAQIIVGTHDFSAFRAAGGARVNPVKTIFEAGCFRADQNKDIIEFKFWGTAFLYHMVRILVGTLVDVGRNILSVEEFQKILAGKNRRMAGITAPPQGLYLIEVKY